MKKFLVIFFALIILSFLAYFLYFLPLENNDVATDAIVAIPNNSTIILKVNNYHRFSENLRNQSHVWKSFKPFPTIATIDSLIAFIDTLTFRSNAFNLAITSNPIYISIVRDKSNSYEFIAVVKASDKFDKDEVENILASYKREYKIGKSEFENASISVISDTFSSKQFLSFTRYKGLLICSSSKSLIESSIAQIKDGRSLLQNPLFSSIYHTAGTKVDANLFCNTRLLPYSFQNFVSSKYKNGLSTFFDVAEWSELDISIKVDEVFLNGFTQAIDTTNSYLRIFENQHPIENRIASVLPSETAFFTCLGITNIDGYLTDYRSYLDKTGNILNYTASLSDFNTTLGENIHELYKSIFLEEIALVYSAFDGLDYNDCWFTVVRSRGQSQSKQLLVDALENYSKEKNIRKSDFKVTIKIDDEKSFEVYKMPIKGINSTLFGSLFSGVSDEYFTFIDNFIVFGSSRESITKFVLANVRNNLLQLDVGYRQFSNLLAAESNYFVYINPHKSDLLFNSILDQKASSSFFDHLSAFNRIQGVAMQLNGGSSMLFNNISIQYSPYTSDDPETAWETRLDTIFTMKPQIVVNHVTRNKEIFLQDVKNKVYLLNDVGRIIWTKQLPEPIIGDIEQVDLLKNNKLQYVFNTRSFIFAIDRRGSFVEGFPVKLRSKATNPIAVFDYDRSRDYRFLVACDDQKIYTFNNNGKPITGWNFRKSERKVYGQLQHFRVKGKDYIVFADENRPYILDRKGEERVNFSRYFSKSQHSKFILDESNSFHPDRLITTDSVGLIKFIYFNGKTEDIAIKAFSSQHCFDYRDIDSDSKPEFIFLDKSQLYVYKQNKNLLFLYKFDADINPEILNISISTSNECLGFFSGSSKKVFLVKGDGSLYNGFPLKGSSPYSIAKLSKAGVTFNLFTGSSRGMLLNYSVK